MKHLNTVKLIRIHEEAIERGWNDKYPRTCFCQEVARRADEMGNDYPSDHALELAKEMLEGLVKDD